jgi:hypothetical protein
MLRISGFDESVVVFGVFRVMLGDCRSFPVDVGEVEVSNDQLSVFGPCEGKARPLRNMRVGGLKLA